jgi:acetyl coenzyme A synthetase (ADP forming)-like protein
MPIKVAPGGTIMTPPPVGLASDVVLRDGSTIRLREMRPDDLPTLRALLDGHGDRAHAAPRARPFPVDAGRSFARGDAGVLVAETGGALVAVASFERETPAGDHAEVRFAIVPAIAGRGIGTRMLEMIAQMAWAEGVRTFDAWVRRDDEALLRMLSDSGFTAERRLEDDSIRVVLSLAHTPAYQDRAAERSEAAATASMRAFFEPRTVAVVGANRERGKIGSEILHNIIKDGYTGRLFVVHPNAAQIEDIPAVPRVTDIPGDVDLVVVSVPARIVSGVVDDCIAKGVKAILVITAGFAETGAAGRALEAEILARVRRAGIRMVGPNCMGLLNTDPEVRLNATFAPVSPPAGGVAMSTQSGALGLAILDYARQLHIGLSTFVSVGNKADVSSNDLIQYWANDPRTHVILLYVESFGNPRKFSQIARRVGRRKPIVAVKSGRSTSGARAAASHTGALASSDAIVDALFRQAGVIRTDTLEQLFDVAMLLANQPVPRGNRVAILTNAGGPGILAADACEANGLTLPPLSDKTTRDLRSFLAPEAAVANPVDMIASASAEQYARALEAVLDDEAVDSVLVIFIPPLVTEMNDVAEVIQRIGARRPAKPIAAIFMSAKGAPPLLAPIPCFQFPEAAAVAMARAAEYGAWLREPPSQVPVFADGDRTAARAVVDRALTRGAGWVTPEESQALLGAAGIRVARQAIAASEEAAVAASARLGYPVVLKAIGAQIVHKTELGAVKINLPDEATVRGAWHELSTRLGTQMTGALVQEMVTGGVEILVGMVQDPTFGPVVACATGGTRAEIFADGQFRLHPLTEADAAAMVNGLLSAPLLRGFRGAEPADEHALVETLLRLSTLIGWCPEIQELDVNPLLVLSRGVCAVDARIRIDQPQARVGARRVMY